MGMCLVKDYARKQEKNGQAEPVQNDHKAQT